MWRAFALEIGKERHAFRAGRNRGRLRVQALVRFSCRDVIACELIAEPGERSAGREHNAHDVPRVRSDVTERVRTQSGIDDGFDASPALVDGEIYLRGYKSLYCIAAAK